MQPNNTPAPNSGKTTGLKEVEKALLKPKATNYAAVVFLTLLVVGFTFHLPAFLYIPVVFFCIAAGVLFFRDIILVQKVAWNPASRPEGTPSKTRAINNDKNPLVKFLKVVCILLGIGSILFVGFIIIAVIALSNSGGIGSIAGGTPWAIF